MPDDPSPPSVHSGGGGGGGAVQDALTHNIVCSLWLNLMNRSIFPQKQWVRQTHETGADNSRLN